MNKKDCKTCALRGTVGCGGMCERTDLLEALNLAPTIAATYTPKDCTLEVAIRVHIKPNLPDMPLHLISGLELQKFLTKLADKTRTRKTVFDVLNGSFRSAVELKLILDNPMQVVKIPVHIRERGATLTASKLAAFTETIKGHWLENLFCTYCIQAVGARKL